MSQVGYNKVQKLYRKKYLEFEKKLETKIIKTIEKAGLKIGEEITQFTKVDGSVDKRYKAKLLEKARRVMTWTVSEIEETMKEGIKGAITIAMKGQDAAATYHIKTLIHKYRDQPKFVELLRTLLADPNPLLLSATYGDGFPDDLASMMWEAEWYGSTLSDKIWDKEPGARAWVTEMMEKGMAEGMAAPELTKMVQDSLLVPGPAWTHAITRSKTGKGTLKYNALRMVRTETNRAYQQAQHISAKNSEIVKGQQWNLSGSHPYEWPPSAAYGGYPEICEYHAYEDHSGLGPGVFPPGEAPWDHPNGLCYLTDVLLSDDEMKEMLEEKYKEFPEEEGPTVGGDGNMRTDEMDFDRLLESENRWENDFMEMNEANMDQSKYVAKELLPRLKDDLDWQRMLIRENEDWLVDYAMRNEILGAGVDTRAYVTAFMEASDHNDLQRIFGDKWPEFSNVWWSNKQEEFIRTYVDRWAFTSGNASDISVGLQLATQEEFGLSTALRPWTEETITSAQEYLLENHRMAGLKKMSRAMYDHTQEQFAEMGLTEVILHRGMVLRNEDIPGDLLNTPDRIYDFIKPAVVDIRTQPLSSFSVSIADSEHFSRTIVSTQHGVITSARVPVEKIHSISGFGLGCAGEGEMVVLGGWDRMLAMARQGNQQDWPANLKEMMAQTSDLFGEY